MRRKLLLLFLIPFLQVLLYTACCGDYQPYFDIVGVELYPIDTLSQRIDSLPITDTLRLLSKHTITFTSANELLPALSGVSAAYALSCDYDGEDGLKYPIEQIDIYSKAAYFTPGGAREKLTDIALFQLYPSYLEDEKYKADAFVAYLQEGGHFSLQQGMQIFITQPSPINSYPQFIIEIRKSNGTVIRAETDVITWK